MSTSSPLRRSVYGLGAATVLTLTLSGPASARPIPEVLTTSTAAGAVSAPVASEPAARPHNPGPPSYNSMWSGWSPPSATVGQAGATVSATDTLQYLQIGLGALSGALLGAGALRIASRTRTHRSRLTHA